MKRSAERDQELAILFGVAEGPWKLHQHAAELARALEWPQSLFELRDFSGAGRPIMSESAAQLDGEEKPRVTRDLLGPNGRKLRT